VPVLLEEVLGFFEGRQVGVYLDGTLGAGGHAAAMLRAHPELHTAVGIDLDPRARGLAAARLQGAGARVVPATMLPGDALALDPQPEGQAPSAGEEGRPLRLAYVVAGNFAQAAPALRGLPSGGLAGCVQAALLDLGVSSMQIDEPGRGFSFMRDGPLDMRMDPGAAVSAEDAVNCWPEAELGRVFREFGEERYWRSIAARVAAARDQAPIRTTQELVRAVGNPGGGGWGGRGGKGGAKGKHPATRVFQALRIAVNGELRSVAAALPEVISCLAPGGRLAVITFHSLEDRIVKWAFRQAAGMRPSDEALPDYCLPFAEEAGEASVRLVTRKPVAPSAGEQAANARSRSAKLRVVERL
jgi:16S rRNA (cytosine1402-N4)-methyltransferase